MTTIQESSAIAQTRIPNLRRFPRSGLTGLAMLLVAWIAAWMPQHPLSAAAFIFLWVGFIFFLDGVAYWRRGTSLWQDHRAKFLQMFLFSVPFWWLFEAFNARLQNWHYLLDHPYGLLWNGLTYNIMATLCFSTVLPAVMEMSSIVTSFDRLRPRLLPMQHGPRVPASVLFGEFALGVITGGAALLWPHYAFGLIWLGMWFLLDPINVLIGKRSSIQHLLAGDLLFLIAIPIASLITGFFWEMWNYFSLPKWYYTIPFVGFAKVFEMPILGYLGYLPFGLELFALYQLLLGVTRQKSDALPF